MVGGRGAATQPAHPAPVADDRPAIRPPRLPVLRTERPHLAGLPRPALRDRLDAMGIGPAYRADQIFSWLHAHGATTFEAMTSLPRALRARLSAEALARGLEVTAVARSADGTRKLLLRTLDGHAIETVLIPNEGRGYTQCVSSMVGCSLTCRFCATAALGFTRMLAAWEIVDQVRRARALLAAEPGGASSRITNVVFMGMGEPLHNFDAVRDAIEILTDERGFGIAGRRITVSTAGIVPLIERFVRAGLAERVGLAVSLNATTQATRAHLMPVGRRYPLGDLLAVLGRVPSPKRRRITLEYVLLPGENDTLDDAGRLGDMARRLGYQVNLIPFNPHPFAPYARPAARAVEGFAAAVRARGAAVYVRTPRGEDIAAACGQLAAEGEGAAP